MRSGSRDSGRRRSETENDSEQRRIMGRRRFMDGERLMIEKKFRLNRIQEKRWIKDRGSGWSRIQAGEGFTTEIDSEWTRI